MVSKKRSTSSKRVAAPTAPVQDPVQKLWLASLGAVAMVRKQGNELVEQVIDRTQLVQERTVGLLRGVVGDVRGQIEGVVGKAVATAQNNLNWVGDTVEDQVSRLLRRVGVPNRADIQELTQRVEELHEQVRALKAKRAA